MSDEVAQRKVPKGAGGTPAIFDDTELLKLIAELRAWPDEAGATTLDYTYRKAIRCISGSDHWPPKRIEDTVERIRKKYPKVGAALEAKAREPTLIVHNGRAFPYSGPRLPSLLDSPPRPPDIARSRSRASSVVAALRERIDRDLQLVASIEGQLVRKEEPDSDLLSLAEQSLAARRSR
jgi:hypothetical protein